MLACRALIMRPLPVLSFQTQVRTISLARIALEPAKKAAPPPPPPPPPVKKTTTTTKTTTPSSKASPVTKTTTKMTTTTTQKATTAKKAATPAVTTRAKSTGNVTDKPRDKATVGKEKDALKRETEREKKAAAKEREKERTRLRREKEKEKVRAQKEREKLRAQKERAKLREKEKKERDAIKAARDKAIQKPYPPPPKRPVSGYILFSRDPTVKRQKGESVTEDATYASAAWKALSDAERDVYNRKTDKAREQFKEDLAKWVSTLNLAQLNAARANKEPGTRQESAMDTLPKRPGNAYAIFLSEVTKRPDFRDKVEGQIEKSTGDAQTLKRMRIGLFGRTVSSMWHSMSDKEKAVYAAKAADSRKQWNERYGALVAAQQEAIRQANP